MIFKNETPYVGKLTFSVTVPPYRKLTDRHSIFNKVHIDLIVIKLISRIVPKLLENGTPMLDSEKLKVLLRKTKGKIGVHEWWLCTSKKTGYIKKKYTKPDTKIWEVNDHRIMQESFVSQKNHYIGDIQRATWYAKNNFEVCEDYPSRVAKKVDDVGTTIGFYGFTRNEGVLFKKGDRVFDATFIPTADDYPDWQWQGWVLKSHERNGESNIDNVNRNIITEIPFNMRGQRTIETWSQAKQSAININKFLKK